MPAAPREDNRTFTEHITVRCPWPGCGLEKLLTRAKRNDHAFPGHYCDGPPPVRFDDRTRHPLRLMVGPEGKGWA